VIFKSHPIRPVALAALFLGLLGWTASAPALTVRDVLDLLDAGVGEEVILEQMVADGSVFHLTVDGILGLKDAGASDALISEMIATGKDREYHSGDGIYDSYSYGYGDYESYRPYNVSIYYDPFGYYWYPSPYYFSYYAPFSYFDFGFYWGGSIWWDWAYWGSRYSYYAYDAGYYWLPYGHDYSGRRDGRRLWSRSEGRSRHNYVLSRKTPRESSVTRTIQRDGSRHWTRDGYSSKPVRRGYGNATRRGTRSGRSAWTGGSRGTRSGRSAWTGGSRGTRSGRSAWTGGSRGTRSGRSAWTGRSRGTRSGRSAWTGGSRGTRSGRSAWTGGTRASRAPRSRRR
jgi:hypothetical protein